MKKRLLCLLLVLVMLLTTVLFSCGNSEEVPGEKTQNRTATTLNFWIISENEVSANAKALIQDAFNAYTETTYATHIEFKFLTEDEYREALDSKMASAKENFKGYISGDGSTITTSLGLTYPAEAEGQVDIVLITGKEMLETYVKNGYLRSMTQSINEKHIAMKSIIKGWLDYAKINGAYYAVPNASFVGEYTYLFVNRQVASHFQFNESDFKTPGDVSKLVNDLLHYGYDEKIDGKTVVPLLSSFAYPTVQYWSANGEPSLMGSLYSAGDGYGYGAIVTNLYNNADYRAYLEMSKRLELMESGAYVTDSDSETFAAAVVKGDYETRFDYPEDEYYRVILDYPRLTEEEVFDSMFAVSSYTANFDRAMEIISELTTETGLRNILQYGVEGIHYEVSETDDNLVSLIKDVPADLRYEMNIEYTGNIFRAYACTDYGMSSQSLIYQRQQYVEKKLDVFYGINESAFSELLANEQAKNLLLQCVEKAQDYEARLDACQTMEEYFAEMDEILLEVEAENCFMMIRVDRDINDKPYPLTLKGAVLLWLQQAQAAAGGAQ